MAWVTSSLYSKIESTKNSVQTAVIRKRLTLVGDNACIQSAYMPVPFKGYVNLYQSQLRITIERSFGVLAHRWGILKGPLVVPVDKVTPLINYLCCLHNYCINRKIASTEARVTVSPLMEKEAYHLNDTVECMNLFDSYIRDVDVNNELVTVALDGGPSNLLGGGEHFNDCPRGREYRRDPNTDGLDPQELMVKSIEERGLLRPLVVDD
jgi:hypothetical protein